MNGLELISKLKQKCNVVYILVVIGYKIELYRNAAFEAGAHEIISKN
jgi:DNA-binding NarL/FixJ family response regulator